jgi:putative endonuclease
MAPQTDMAAQTDMDRQQLGRVAEDIAVAFLLSHGLEILLRNFRRRAGELDIIARQRDVLVIVEVRTRSDTRFGGAAASVGRSKQRRLVRAAQQLLQQRRDLARLPARFDVIVVHGPESANQRVQWIQHAFTARAT